jgi:hypothetical protein
MALKFGWTKWEEEPSIMFAGDHPTNCVNLLKGAK